MDEKQKKYLYIGLGIIGSILLFIGIYYLYKYLSKPNLTPEQKSIISNIEAKEALRSQQAKSDTNLANRYS